MKKLPEVNQLVVLNNEPDATLYRVKETEGKRGVGLFDATIEDKRPIQRIQWVDVSLVFAPSVGQLAEFNK